MTVEHAIAGLALALLAAFGAVVSLAVRVRALDASLTAVKLHRGWWGPPCDACDTAARRRGAP